MGVVDFLKSRRFLFALPLARVPCSLRRSGFLSFDVNFELELWTSLRGLFYAWFLPSAGDAINFLKITLRVEAKNRLYRDGLKPNPSEFLSYA